MNNHEPSPAEKKARARLRELDAQIEALSAKADRIEADAEMKGQDVLERIKAQRNVVAERLEEMRDKSGSALQEVGEGLRKAVDDLSGSVSRAVDRLTGKENQ